MMISQSFEERLLHHPHRLGFGKEQASPPLALLDAGTCGMSSELGAVPKRSTRKQTSSAKNGAMSQHERSEPARYGGEIIAGALMIPESRIVAELLLRELASGTWEDAIVTRNVLKTRSKARAVRTSNLIRNRLESMQPALWKMVRDEKGVIATHAVLAAAVKQSPLLGDFLALVVGEQYRRFAQSLSNKLWDDYLDGCRERDPKMPHWSDATRNRLRSSVFQTLAQAGYIENTRSLRLQTVHVAGRVLDYLRTHNETYVLNCIQVAP